MILLLLTNHKTYDRMKAWDIVQLTFMYNKQIILPIQLTTIKQALLIKFDKISPQKYT